MSEKPFWEGKTGEELAGLHVKVTFETGAVAEGILNDRCIHLGSYSFFRVFGSGHDGLVEPATPIKSIELVDDPKYERIDDINAVRKGDVFVANDGNKYLIDGVDTNRVSERCRAYLSYAPDFWLSNSAFAYALRLKPRLPDEPGLWLDKDDVVWCFDGFSLRQLDDLEEAWSVIRTTQFAPFRPAKAVEA